MEGECSQLAFADSAIALPESGFGTGLTSYALWALLFFAWGLGLCCGCLGSYRVSIFKNCPDPRSTRPRARITLPSGAEVQIPSDGHRY